MIKNIIYVEDGSVDLDELKSTLTTETKIIVYRQGSYPPSLVQPRLPINDIFSEADFTGDSNTGDGNTGYSNAGDGNTGDSNTGNGNTGDSNTGNWNTGDRNTGHSNTGHSNTGNYNTGNFNPGYRNTGNYNTGNSNAGDSNTGIFNTGDSNTGYGNAGNFNTGDGNTGDFNSCHFSNGVFCTEEPKINIFNKKSKYTMREFMQTEYYRALYSAPINLVKEQNGQTVAVEFKTACAEWWEELSIEDKQTIREMPNFDAKIFEEITGIKEEK